MLSIAWQITYTVTSIALLIGLSAVIVVGSITCVRFAKSLLNLPEDR